MAHQDYCGGVGTEAVAVGEEFRHEALFYAGLADFVDATTAFII